MDSLGRLPHGLSRRPAVWLNLVCLDAPLVALAWQWIFAREFSAGVSTADRVALFLTAWLIYLGDRLFDAIALPVDARVSLRERFCAEHRAIWVGGILVIAALDAVVVGRFLERATLRLGTVLAVLVGAYLIANLAFSRLWKTIPLKEITVGSLFAAGTILALLPSLPSPTRGFGAAALLFAGLCSLNCMSIAFWERPLDASRGRHSMATKCPRLERPIAIASIAFAAASAALVVGGRPLGSLAACLSASFGLLAALNAWTTTALDEKTALADLVLLTPGLFLLLERMT